LLQPRRLATLPPRPYGNREGAAVPLQGFMLLWIAFAVLTAAVLVAVLAPLVRPQREPEPEAAASADLGALAVYRHQLDEVEAERARGVIEAAEADAARLEISRRLLASAARREQAGSAPAPPRALLESRHATLALVTAVLLPLAAAGLYLLNGAPGLALAEMAAARDRAVIADLVAKVEARLRAAPDDGRGWQVIAPVYLKLGRFREAADAYAKAARLQGETVALLAGLAEASVLAAGGRVTPEARAAYGKILKLEPGRVEPRFWLAMAKEQDGRLADALADYKALLAEAAPGAAYRPPLTQRIRAVSARIAAGKDAPPAGPTADDVAAAAKLAPEERARMIAQMVDGLAVRLKSNGRDLPGWLRLMRAYAVLDRKDDARAALAEARRNFAGDADALAQLAALAASLGLGS
jgi:cytochrome c-type biogenesis protein CcmH